MKAAGGDTVRVLPGPGVASGLVGLVGTVVIARDRDCDVMFEGDLSGSPTIPAGSLEVVRRHCVSPNCECEHWQDGCGT